MLRNATALLLPLTLVIGILLQNRLRLLHIAFKRRALARLVMPLNQIDPALISPRCHLFPPIVKSTLRAAHQLIPNKRSIWRHG